MAWGWRGSSKNPAGSDPVERDRVGWLSDHGIAPMNRSTRMWDMEVWAPWYARWTHLERVGSKDRAQRALDLQRGGSDFAPIQWQGSKDMATGRAYDWCYCIEAVSSPEVDGRVACQCQCADCAPKGKGATAVHWRKRNQMHRIRVQMIAHATRNKYGWRGFRRRWERRWARWVEFWTEVGEEGFFTVLFASDREGGDDDWQNAMDTPPDDHPAWYQHYQDGRNGEGPRTGNGGT